MKDDKDILAKLNASKKSFVEAQGKQTKEAEDIVIETDADLDDSVVGEESAQETIKKLREQLKKVTAEKQEYLNGWQRARADYANFKKEQEEVKKDFIKFANERLFDELIPVLDSFDMAFGNKEAWEKADLNWRIGIEYIYNQLVKSLSDNCLTQYSANIGDKMDNAKFEAVGIMPTEDEKNDHTVAVLIKKGYLLGGQIFRPSQVKVFEMKK